MSDIVVIPQPQPFAIPASYGASGASVAGPAGSNVMAIPSRATANGSNVNSAALVKTACADPSRPGQGGADYSRDSSVDLGACPQAGFTDNLGQKYRIVSEQPLNSQQFYDATDSSYGQCIQRGLDYLHNQIGINGGLVDAYRGSVPFRVPAGDYVSNIPIDIYHTVDVFGDGSGDGGPSPAAGATHIKFTGCSGFRIQNPTTFGDTGVDVGGAHPGVGRAKLRMMMLSGDYAGVNTDRHAVIHRAIADIEDVYARDWGGLTIKNWTGNVRGTNYHGQTSTSSYSRVKGENCVGTFSILGTDSNVIQTDGCQGYQNRQFGFEDGNEAGANKHRGMHCTFNGLVPPAAGPFVACSQSGNIYTPNLQCVDFTNLAGLSALLNAHAPSGTTASNSYWLYVQPGAPSAATPAYSSAGPWIYGGDMLALTPWATEWDSCYMEGGGLLSQSFYRHPVWNGGTIDRTQLNGGTLLKSTDDAFELIRTGSSNFTLRTTDGGACSISFKDYDDVVRFLIEAAFGGGTTVQTVSSFSWQVISGGVPVDVAMLDFFGLKLRSGKYLRDNADKQVLGARLSALPADATDLTTVIALANAIKARGKATGGHGFWED